MGEPDETELSESQLLAERREKLARLRESGVEPYPHAFEGRTDIAAVRGAHQGVSAGEGTNDRDPIARPGAAPGGQGKAAVPHLVDRSGRGEPAAREGVGG